jgi:tetratricopeptide (TPR) repeat protein
MNRVNRLIPALLVGGMLAMAACTPATPSIPTAAPEKPPTTISPMVPDTPAPSTVSTLEQTRKQVAAHRRAGRYQAALAVIEQERRSGGSQRALAEEQLQVLQELFKAGEEFLRTGEYERSGRSLRLLLNHYPQEQTAADRLGISRKDLQEHLELCAEQLMGQGLAKYRAGNLPAAIDIWKKILAFHSTHDGAKKGIQTAEIQLKNLRTLQ